MKRIEKRGKELLERKKIEGKNCLKLLNGKKKMCAGSPKRELPWYFLKTGGGGVFHLFRGFLPITLEVIKLHN